MFSVVKVVFRLLGNWLLKIVPITDEISLSNVIRSPNTSSPVVCVSLLDQPVEGSADLLHGSIIGTMSKNHINVINAQVFQ